MTEKGGGRKIFEKRADRWETKVMSVKKKVARDVFTNDLRKGETTRERNFFFLCDGGSKASERSRRKREKGAA